MKMGTMNIVAGFFRKLILIRVRMDGGEILQKQLAVVCVNKGKASIIEWKNFDFEYLPKLKNNLAVLLIVGDRVVTKIYNKEDQAIKRIITNPELIWSIDVADGRDSTLSFLRKENVDELLQSVTKSNLFLIDTWIRGADDEIDMNTKLDHSYQTLFNDLCKSADWRNTLTNLLFNKMLLPVLSFFLLFLLGNYFLYSHYTEQYLIKQSKIRLEERGSKDNSLSAQKENQLIAQYSQIPNRSFAVLADRIASYIPNNLFLTSMEISPMMKAGNVKVKNELKNDFQVIRLVGYVETPGSVTLLSQLLEADILFSKVRVVSLYRKKEVGNFEFELEITL